MWFLFYLSALCLTDILLTAATTATSPPQPPTKFYITIKPSDSTALPPPASYKSVHVQYTVPSSSDRWNIVSIAPFIQRSNRTIRQLTVHICSWSSISFHRSNVWYDDPTYCQSSPSMLIYYWAPPSPLSTFQIADDLGFQMDKSKSIVVTVTYAQDQHAVNEHPGVNLDVSTLIPRFHLGTFIIGHHGHGTRYTCRTAGPPRLLYTIKPLFPETRHGWWRVYVVRNRSFGRKIVQLVLDSTGYSSEEKTDADILSADVFLVSGDYVIAECETNRDSTCKFLILYAYKNRARPSSTNNVHSCQAIDYPQLFKLLPSTDVSKTTTPPPKTDETDAASVFQFICLMLVVIWILTILGCVIMRRIRGLVNYRPEPVASVLVKPLKPRNHRSNRPEYNQQRLAADADMITQLDVDHMVT